jgi:hypothetical protein
MDERHLKAEEAGAGRLVDQTRAGLPQPLQLGSDVGNLERNMVQTRATACKEAPDRRVGPERRQKLDPARAGMQGRGIDSLVLEASAMLELGTEQPPVRLDRGVEVGDCDPDVVGR